MYTENYKIRVKNMKKFYRAAALALAAVVLMTGCSSKNSSNSDNLDIIDATSAVGSYCGVTEIGFSASGEGKKIAMGTTGNIEMQIDPFFSKIGLVITSSEEDAEPEIMESTMLLSDGEEDKTVYLLHNDEWQKETVETDNLRIAASQYDVLATGQLLMEASADMKKTGSEDYNGISADRYDGTISPDIMPSLFNSTGSLALVGTNIGRSYFKNCDDLNVAVWVDGDGVILGYELDLTSIVQSLFDELYKENGVTDETVMTKFESYTAKGYVTEYNNKIDTAIPEEALAAPEYNAENGGAE